MPRSVFLAISLLFVAVPALSQPGEATFEGLGDLPGGDFESEGGAVSADGSVVVGQSDSGIGLIEAFRWENGQMEGLGDLPGGQTGSWARDVSADGSVVVGVSNSNNGNEAFRWEDGVMQGLGELPGGGVSSNGFGVSGDGAVAVGASSSENGLEGFRWENGEMEPLGTLPGGNTGSWAYGISTDGSTIVGFAGSENGSEGFRWVDGEMEGLGLLPGGSNSTAYAVSTDGSVVVGRGDSDNAFFEEAFRWEDGQMVGLGDIDDENGVRSQARAVSADGTVIVGEGNMTTFDGEAFVWTEEWGVRSVKEVLENDYGLDLTGWELDRSTGVSADGTVIVGTGVNPDGNTEGWRAFLPTEMGEVVRHVNGAIGSDTSDCTDEAIPCATISYAIDQANADDTIEIADGEYTESIGIDKSLILQGESTTGTIIQAHESPGEATGRVITVDGSIEVEIADVTIRHGVASGTGSDGVGGGLSVSGATLSLDDVAIRENEADQGGGGMYNDTSSPMLTNVVLSQNTAGINGGGMRNDNGSSPTLTNVVFYQNAANTGAAMFNNGNSSTLTNVTISGNEASLIGGGVYNTSDSSPTLVNSIVWGNSAGFNANEIYNASSSSITLLYSLYSDGEDDVEVGGGVETESSLTVDPLFVDPDNGDFHLEDVSPAINAGDPDTDFAVFPVNDAGDPIDLDGASRLFDDVIDIGAYETQGIVADDASTEEITWILSAPNPNPVGGVATFTLAVERGQNVTVELFDALGRRVKTLYEGALADGMSETLTLDASVLPPGAYLIRATGEDFTRVRQMTVMK